MLASRARTRATASRLPAGRSRFSPRALLAAVTSIVVLGSTLIPATAAFAAEPAAVRNTKTTNATLVHPGDTFNWMIEVGCSVLKDDCVNATLTDVIPDEFILPDPGDILLTPALNASERTITITGQTVTVAFHQDLLRPAGQKGLTNGVVTVTIPVTVRSDLDYTPAPRTVENTSEMVADNAPLLLSTAAVQLEVPLELATQPSKSFSPASNIAVAGLETELTLGGSNTSNAPVTTLTIQDPVDPTVPGNIFRTALALQSLGAVTWPTGATSATVSLWDATLPTPAWVAAAPVAVGGTLLLPAAVDPADAGGIRIEFSSGATPEIPRNASAAFVLDLENRAGVTVGSYPNVAQSTVVRDALSASRNVTASYAVIAATSAVSAGKSITPDRMSTVAFGANDLTSGTVTLSGGNAGSIPLTSLTIAEPTDPTDLTSANPLAPAHPGGGLLFDGFTAGVAWPAGATGASITYYYSDSSSETLVATAPGVPAADGARRVTGFSVTFTGMMAQGVTATVPFTIKANPLQVSPNLSQLYSNTIAVTGVDVYSQPVGPKTATDTVTVLAEQVNLTTSKTLTRTELRSAPNQSTVATLTTKVAGYPDSTRALDEIVMLDPPTETGLTDWYKYFDAYQVVLTQVPGNATLTISYRDAAGVYHVLDVLPTGTRNYLIPSALRDSIYGLKLTWKSTTGFQPGQTLVANVAYELRDTLRDTTTPLPDAAATLQNCSSSNGTSVAAPEAILSNVAQSDPCPTVTLVPTEDGNGGDGGADLLDKRFINTNNANDQTLISTRNDSRTRVRLSWSTDGYSDVASMTIYDGPVDASGDPAPASWADKGMFDAFNLVSIPRITAALDPLRTYDHVYAELYNKDTHAWEIPVGWCDKFSSACDGDFPARTLDEAQQEKYVAIQFVFTERTGRTGIDPAVGSGVAASLAHNRNIDLVFQLRDSLRSDPASPVVDGYRYNTGLASGHSVVLNGARAQALLSQGGYYVDHASDTIELRDPQLAVGVTKTWTGGDLAIPDSTVTVRPTSRVTITATNQTVGKVDSLTIAEPNPTGVTPNDSPFEQFDLLRFQSIAHPIGAAALTVTVTRTAGGDLTATGAPDAVRTTVLAWTSTDLAAATGVTFVYTGRIAGSSSSTASIVLDLGLRETTRTGGAAITAGTVYNSTQAVVADERWDSESSTTDPEFTDVELDARADANITLVASTIGVTTSKTFATTSQVEPTRDAIRLTLQAMPSGSERVQSLTITDDRATFWNAFDFVALPTSGDLLTLPIFSPAPGGSGTVIQVEACVDRAWEAIDIADAPDAGCVVSGGHWVGAGVWKTQAQARADFLPTGVTVDQVEGLRITIQRADGSQWENPQAPTVGIPLMVQRRVDLRTGDPVRTSLAGNAASPGETVAGRTTNGLRADVVGIWGKSAFATNTANYLYQYQTSGVRVHKTPAGVKAPGRLFDYTLSVTNTGNWPIMNPVVTDYLPSDGVGAMLIFDPDKPWTYSYALSGPAPSPASGTALPSGTTGPAVDVQADAYGPQKLTFTFPAGSVLEVGQTYLITIPMMFRPGLVNDTIVTNDFSIRGDRGFDTCTAPAGATATYDATTGECSTGTTVRPSEQAALRALMTVKAETDAEYPIDLGYTGADDCDTAVDAAGFSRLPCIPLTLPGQKETWRLTAQNTGTTQMPRLVLSTRLPDVADATILDGFVRDSRWQAGFADEITANLGVPGATMTVYYTTATAPCKLVLQTPSNEGACGTDPATGWALWTAGTLADPTIVTGLQFVIDFPTDHLFRPAEILTIDITTRTAALSSTPGADTTANNSLSASAISRTGTTDTPVTALDYSVVSVALATGSVQLTKEVTGPAASFLPDGQVFTGSLVCTSLEETVSYPFTLTADTSTVPATVPGVRFDNLPGGASCTVSETTASGQTTYTATTVIVDPLADPTELPTVALVNDYRFAGITISKTVTTTAPVIPDAYAFTLSCTFLGVAVPLDADDASFTLDAGDVKTVTGIPANSTCVVTETDAKGADATIMTAQTDATHPGASVVVDQTARTATFTRLSPDTVAGVTNTAGADNRFAAPAALIVTKHLAGGGADQFGADQTFSVDILCTFGATTQYDDTVELNAANGWQAVLENIIAGSECTFAEDGLQGADAVTITPNDGVDTTVGTLTVPGPTQTEPSPVVDIDVTNWYLTGSVEVTKTFAGDAGAIDKFAVDPVPAVEFEFELGCVRNGEDVVIPGGGTRTVTAGSPVAVYTGLASGSECTIVETRTGGASLSLILDENGDDLVDGVFLVSVDDTVLSVDDQAQPELSIENTFRFADVSATKKVVDAPANRIAAIGPFELTLQCTLDGRDIEAAEPAVASIREGETVTWTELAEGAECTIEETDTGGATRTSTALTAADGTLGSAVTGVSVELEPLRWTGDSAPNHVEFTNSFRLAYTGSSVDFPSLLLLPLGLLLGGALLVGFRTVRRRTEARTARSH